MRVFKQISIILIISMAINAGVKAQNISFQVSFTEPQAHYANVKMMIAENSKESIDVKMPVWTPGSYLIREFSKNVEGFAATDGANVLPSEKINKNTWRIYAAKKSKIIISYRVYAFEISVRTSFVDASHAFLSPTGIFMYPDGEIEKPSTVTILPFKDWDKISTGLEQVAGKMNSFYASNFDILFDSPIEVGNQDIFEFDASGVKHQVAMYGGGNYNKDTLKRDMAKIVEAETSVFGENPNKKYVFIVHNYHSSGGGLEHLNSTVLGASRNAYKSEDGYNGFLGLVAHEYFHLWNVKRLRPIALGPFNYDAENYTTNLWIAEGFTTYFTDQILRRTGLNTVDPYLNEVVGQINTLENLPGKNSQSVSESSFDAWIKQYRPNENSRNSGISYYNKGAVIGMLLDLEILNATNGKARLDDVMKTMYNEYYKMQGRGYTGAEFKVMLEKISGTSFEDFYKKYIYGTEPLDYNKFLKYAGFELKNNTNDLATTLGIIVKQKDVALLVSGIDRNSAAWNDGLNVNDEILAINDIKVGYSVHPQKDEIDQLIARFKIGDTINVLISRDGLIKNLKVKLTDYPRFKYQMIDSKNISEKQSRIRARWLNL